MTIVPCGHECFWQLYGMATGLKFYLTIVLYGRQAFWQLYCMAVVLRIILVIFIPYIRKIFPIKIIWDVFDNCPVWLWTFLTIVLYGREAMNLLEKSLTIVLYDFRQLYHMDFRQLSCGWNLTKVRFPRVCCEDFKRTPQGRLLNTFSKLEFTMSCNFS